MTGADDRDRCILQCRRLDNSAPECYTSVIGHRPGARTGTVRSNRIDTVIAKNESRLSFIESELIQADEKVLTEAMEKSVRMKTFC